MHGAPQEGGQFVIADFLIDVPVAQQSRANLIEFGVSRHRWLNQPGHAGVGRAGLLGIFNSRVRVEGGQGGEDVAAAFLNLMLQLANAVEASDRTGVKLLDLRVGPAQVIDYESAKTNDRCADCQARQRKAVLYPE